jgi:hypothetical protein
MGIEEDIRDAITHRVSRVKPAEKAWDSISRRIEGRGKPSPARRASVAVFALALTALTIFALWASFGHTTRPVPLGEPTAPSASAGPESEQTVCFESQSEGDFDGDGATETASLYALVPGSVKCDGAVAEIPWRFELTITRASSAETVQPFDDCQSIDCHLQDASDFDADGTSELVVAVGPGASVSYTQIYRAEGDQLAAIQLELPGDPEGSLTPGPILLGGSHNAIWQSGFQCQVHQDGSRAVIAWQAKRDDGELPWNVHFTTLELHDDNFAVVAIEDRNGVTELPADRSCP